MYVSHCCSATTMCRLTVLGIKYEDLAYTSSNGFAAVGSNNGKNGTNIGPDDATKRIANYSIRHGWLALLQQPRDGD